MKNILQDLSKEEVADLIKELGQPSFRANQIWQGIILGKSVDEMSNLSADLKQKLNEKFESLPIEIYKKFVGEDGTQKFVYKLSDGNLIEGVLLSYKYGYTICVSTQVGCRMGCKFCASTLNGLIRNLSAGEILAQVLRVNAMLGGKTKDERKITNIVLMGSGEPLDNYDNVAKFLRLVSNEDGINISQRNISVSTCGLVDKIYKLADDGFNITLTISLHAPTDEKRKVNMPVANAFKIDDILTAVKYYFNKTGRRIIFEYALIKDFNDTQEDVNLLSEKFKGFPLHFNIIPLNEVSERGLISSGRKRAYVFAGLLENQGVSATVRRTMGEDIGGACGQLRNKVIRSEN